MTEISHEPHTDPHMTELSHEPQTDLHMTELSHESDISFYATIHADAVTKNYLKKRIVISGCPRYDNLYQIM